MQLDNIKLLALDVDGVMTDGKLYFSDSGQEMKAFYSIDGHGLNMLKKSGIQLAIITGRQSQLVEFRAKNLKIDYVYQGAQDKLAAFQALLTQTNLLAEQVAYMGDDVIDLPVMRRAGFAVSVPDAPSLVQEHAHYVTKARGGQGAIREVCELIVRTQKTYDAAIAYYLR